MHIILGKVLGVAGSLSSRVFFSFCELVKDNRASSPVANEIRLQRKHTGYQRQAGIRQRSPVREEELMFGCLTKSF